MQRISFALFVLAAGCAALVTANVSTASSSQREPVDYQAATPSNVAAALRAADKVIVQIVEQVDGEFTQRPVTVRDRRWIERCAAIFEASSFETIPLCLCITWPQIEIHQAGWQPLRIGPHGTKGVQFLGRSSGKFVIGEAQADALRSLLEEQKLLHSAKTE